MADIILPDPDDYSTSTFSDSPNLELTPEMIKKLVNEATTLPEIELPDTLPFDEAYVSKEDYLILKDIFKNLHIYEYPDPPLLLKLKEKTVKFRPHCLIEKGFMGAIVMEDAKTPAVLLKIDL